MHVVGIDLSGPSNPSDTVATHFELRNGELRLARTLHGASDAEILDLVGGLSGNRVVAGLDAPLSYNPGGGDRPADAELRRKAIAAGLHAGTVMTPTMTRMVYLTIRGICVARALGTIKDVAVEIVEVHPGTAMALRGASIEAIRSFKSKASSREELVRWLGTQGLELASVPPAASDHFVASCAAALAAWRWHQQRPEWIYSAEPPTHPFDFAC